MKMFRSSFAKLPKHKTFEYTPRYYDPEEEARKQRRELKLERGSFYRHHKSPLVRSMTSRNDRIYRRSRSRRNQGMRILLLIGMLGIVSAYILGLVSGIFTVAFVCVFMLVFISKVNSI